MALSYCGQIIEIPTQANTYFVVGDVLEGHLSGGIAGGRNIAKREIAVTDGELHVGRDPVRHARHRRPGEIPLAARAIPREGRRDRALIVADPQARGTDAAADIGRGAIPTAEVEIAVEQRGDGGHFG